MANSTDPRKHRAIEPLSDQAALVYCPDESAALTFTRQVRGLAAPWLVDVVQAYTSVAIFFDLNQVNFATVAGLIAELPEGDSDPSEAGTLHVIPCCYELGLDLARIAAVKGLTEAEVVRLHSSEVYTVYAIGFCPGFPYLGYLPEPLCGVPRLPSPRLRLEAGSVGLTGRQTGIYTEPRPGGWNIIGRTPLPLVDVARGYFPLRTGDRVQFRAISRAEHEALQATKSEPRA